MPITINNVTANNQITIINDAGINPNNPNDGPRAYSGNTECDVIIDGVGYMNLNGSDIVPTNIHALQFNAASNSGELEYTGTEQNLVLSSASDIPSWANTMITRWNGEKTYYATYQTEYDNALANLDVSSETYEADVNSAQTAAQSAATTAKNNILGA